MMTGISLSLSSDSISDLHMTTDYYISTVEYLKDFLSLFLRKKIREVHSTLFFDDNSIYEDE